MQVDLGARSAAVATRAPARAAVVRREVAAGAALVGVSAAAAVFAHVFKTTAAAMIRAVHHARDPIAAVRQSGPALAVVGMIGALVLAVVLARRSERCCPGRTGLHEIARAARGEGPGPRLGPTLLRSLGTWTVSGWLASIGRETAIIETGGALGTAVGRRGRFGPSLAAGGIAAAFAAAYHAPLAALLYVEEHLGVRRDRRALVYTFAGALVGHAVTVGVLGGEPVFPGTHGPRAAMVVLGLVALVPAVLAARLVLELRERMTASWLRQRTGWGMPAAVGAFAVVAALVVVAVPLTAGNGMEALRQSSTSTILGVALALALAKLIASIAALGTGAPGGALSPTMSIVAGWALLTFVALDGLGLHLPGDRWDGMVVAMAIGVAVGLRSPLVAVLLVPEMLGDISLVPVCAVMVALAVVLDRGIDRVARRHGEVVPAGVNDEDA